MNKLKTLKDWRREIANLDEWKEHKMQVFRCEEWLKEEAVKWVKELRQDMSNYIKKEERAINGGGIGFIKHFFNLTEEDLEGKE